MQSITFGEIPAELPEGPFEMTFPACGNSDSALIAEAVNQGIDSHLETIFTETGEAPDQIIAYWLDETAQPSGSRPICSYPNVAQYDGQRDPRDAASFSCADDE